MQKPNERQNVKKNIEGPGEKLISFLGRSLKRNDEKTQRASELLLLDSQPSSTRSPEDRETVAIYSITRRRAKRCPLLTRARVPSPSDPSAPSSDPFEFRRCFSRFARRNERAHAKRHRISNNCGAVGGRLESGGGNQERVQGESRQEKNDKPLHCWTSSCYQQCKTVGATWCKNEFERHTYLRICVDADKSRPSLRSRFMNFSSAGHLLSHPPSAARPKPHRVTLHSWKSKDWTSSLHYRSRDQSL